MEINIERINELAHKAKSNLGLTEEEREEQKRLRQAYIDQFKASLQSQLDNMYVVDPQGNKRKLEKKHPEGEPGSH